MKPVLFGLPTGGDDSVIVGLPALREFKYIVFDDVRGEVEFSNGEAFEPGEPELWARYPLTIEEDLRGNMFVFVQIPIGGEKTELQLGCACLCEDKLCRSCTIGQITLLT